MIGAGEAYAAGQFSSDAPPPTSDRRTDIIKVRNDTGSNRLRGHVVGLEGSVLTEVTPENIWLKAIATKRGKKFGILRYDLPSTEINEAQLSGVCVARVNVSNVSHRCAKVPDDGTFVLKSSFSGPIDLLWCPSSTGEADCVVNLRGDTLPIFKAPSGGIPARSGTTCGSAACKPYYITDAGVLTEQLDHLGASQSVTVYSIFSEAVAANAYITAKDVHGILAVDSEDCG